MKIIFWYGILGLHIQVLFGLKKLGRSYRKLGMHKNKTNYVLTSKPQMALFCKHAHLENYGKRFKYERKPILMENALGF